MWSSYIMSLFRDVTFYQIYKFFVIVLFFHYLSIVYRLDKVALQSMFGS